MLQAGGETNKQKYIFEIDNLHFFDLLLDIDVIFPITLLFPAPQKTRSLTGPKHLKTCKVA